MIENVQGGGVENVNVSSHTTGHNYINFAHSSNASGIQCAYDETIFVTGLQTCLGNGNILCSSLSTWINTSIIEHCNSDNTSYISLVTNTNTS